MILAVSGHNLPLHYRQRRPESPPKVLILLDPGLRTSGGTVEDEFEAPRAPPRYGTPARSRPRSCDLPPVAVKVVLRPVPHRSTAPGPPDFGNGVWANDREVPVRSIHRCPSDIVDRRRAGKRRAQGRRGDTATIPGIPFGNDQHDLRLGHARLPTRNHSIRQEPLAHELVERFVEPGVQGNSIAERRRRRAWIPVPAPPRPPLASSPHVVLTVGL